MKFRVHIFKAKPDAEGVDLYLGVCPDMIDHRRFDGHVRHLEVTAMSRGEVLELMRAEIKDRVLRTSYDFDSSSVLEVP